MSMMIKILDQWQELERLRPEVQRLRDEKASYDELREALGLLVERHKWPYRDSMRALRQMAYLSPTQPSVDYGLYRMLQPPPVDPYNDGAPVSRLFRFIGI